MFNIKNPVFSIQEKAIRSAEIEKLIRTVALEYNKDGSLRVFAAHCKVSYHGIRTAIRRGYFTPFMACAIEIGTHQKITKEQLAPHIYK